MSVLSLLGLVSRTLSRNKVRTGLSMLCVTLGVAAFTILSSIGESTRVETMARFKNMLGTFDTLVVRPGGQATRGMVSLANVDSSLTSDDASALGGLTNIRQVAEVQNAFNVDLTYRDRSDPAGVFGVTANFTALRGDQISDGEGMQQGDIDALSRVAVIGDDVRNRLFPGIEPVGKTIRINGVPFLVKGVLLPRGAGPTGASLDNLVLIPISTASRRLFNRNTLTMMIVQLKDPAAGDATVKDVEALLHRRHHLASSQPDDFNVTSPRAVITQIAAAGSTFQTLLLLTSAIFMGLGMIVISIVTLAGIANRFAEIGIKRAVGASKGFVFGEFLLEATLVSLAGGWLGVLIGVGGTQGVASLQHLPFLINPWAIAAATAGSALVGIFAGVVPATKAAMVDPIEALRT